MTLELYTPHLVSVLPYFIVLSLHNTSYGISKNIDVDENTSSALVELYRL